ncbi:MAG: CoA transferase, partial [Dehalococcoidia bacterium]
MPDPTTEAHGALHGVRVLEFSQIVAGPFAGVVLSDLGADVVKVEPPEGEGYRNQGAVV